MKLSTTKEADVAGMVTIEFSELKQAIQRKFNQLKDLPLFRVKIDKDEIWNLYLSSFPVGTNPVFRERSEHDCSCCRSFVKNAGDMIAIVDGEIVTLWDVEIGAQYQPVVDALAAYVKSKAIDNVFLSAESKIGTDNNREDIDGRIVTWQHFHIALPQSLQCKRDIGAKLGEYQAMHDVVLRSLQEISIDAVETVLDLISQNSLYRGSEKRALLDAFLTMKRQFDELPTSSHDMYAWQQVLSSNAFVCRIRNDVVGTLLVDLSEGKELEIAVKAFEDKVSGTNYKRPTALVTPKMRDAAKAAITELGYMPALDRRYARLEDVKITNVLFADRSVKSRMSGDVFDDIQTKGDQARNFDKIEEISIDKFISDVLPTATKLEVLFENKHSPNLVSLIAPYDLTAKSMFKWDNPFSWSYNGDLADSVKERVKRAGGNVTGDVCCRLAWYNTDDLDFHMHSPIDHIHYAHKTGFCGGNLDVDMNVGSVLVTDPVENIVYPNLTRMNPGNYKLSVNQFTCRNSTNVGFEVEIDILGEVHHFAYDKKVSGNVDVATLVKDANGITVNPHIQSTTAKRKMWGIDSQTFHTVSALMLSPNFWDGKGVGNKHFFFMLDGCQNDGSARGFYNEFLSSELEPHRKTVELVGSRMRTEEVGDQMSGIGFSSTQRNTIVVKVHGSFVRTLKIAF